MRFILPTLVIALGGPAGAAILAHASIGAPDALAGVAAILPDPATAAVLFGGLGLVAGARRARSNARAD